MTCDFAPQESTQRQEPSQPAQGGPRGGDSTASQRSDSASLHASGDEGGEGNDDDDAGGGEGGGDEVECDVEGAEGREKKRKKKSLAQGSNAQTNRMMRVVMPFLLGSPVGPSMGDGPSRNDRNRLASEGILRYQVAGMTSMAQAIKEGSDSEMDGRIRDSVLTADKVEIALLIFFSCI